jgi:hypothetical protein
MWTTIFRAFSTAIVLPSASVARSDYCELGAN